MGLAYNYDPREFNRPGSTAISITDLMNEYLSNEESPTRLICGEEFHRLFVASIEDMTAKAVAANKDPELHPENRLEMKRKFVGATVEMNPSEPWYHFE